MTRRACRISHDEVARMVKAAQHCGLSVGEIVFNGSEVRLVIGGDIGERVPLSVDGNAPTDGPIREPQL